MIRRAFTLRLERARFAKYKEYHDNIGPSSCPAIEKRRDRRDDRVRARSDRLSTTRDQGRRSWGPPWHTEVHAAGASVQPAWRSTRRACRRHRDARDLPSRDRRPADDALAVVTGGARGVGKAIAKHLVARRARARVRASSAGTHRAKSAADEVRPLVAELERGPRDTTSSSTTAGVFGPIAHIRRQRSPGVVETISIELGGQMTLTAARLPRHACSMAGVGS